MPIPKIILAAIAMTLGLGMCSCRREAREAVRGIDERFSYRAEGVDLSMAVRGTEIGLSGLVELVFEIDHFSDVEVEIAPSDSWRGEFAVYSLDEAPGRMTDGGRGILRRVVYLLEPQRAGDFVVDKIEVDHWHTDQPLLRESIVMDPFSVQVTSLVANLVGENTDAADIMDIEGPWIAEEGSPYWGLAVLMAVLCGGVIVWFRWKQNPGEAIEQGVEPTPGAGEVAIHELTKLLDERLCERGLFDPFFVRLSDIVRQYIESRFERPVMSQTTEEFLAKISQSEVFDGVQKKMLGGFYTQWDNVKYARVEVNPEAAQVSAENCKCFVATTMEETR